MKITVEQLSKLAANLSILEMAAKFTANTVDDWVVKMLRIVGDDEQMLEQIVDFLNWTPLFGCDDAAAHNDNEPCLPDCCKEFEAKLVNARGRSLV